MTSQNSPPLSTLTSEEAAYLESLGFVPSAFSTSSFVLMAGSGAVTAVVERVPFAFAQKELRWSCRAPYRLENNSPRLRVTHNDLTTLIVLAKLEGIL